MFNFWVHYKNNLIDWLMFSSSMQYGSYSACHVSTCQGTHQAVNPASSATAERSFSSLRWLKSGIPGNMTKDCHDWCTRIYTGLTFLSESVTNFVYWHIDVSSGRLQCTCRTTAHQYPKLLHDNTCVQPLVTGWWFCNIGSARTAVGHSLSLARWPSTFCPMSCATPPSTQLSDDF